MKIRFFATLLAALFLIPSCSFEFTGFDSDKSSDEEESSDESTDSSVKDGESIGLDVPTVSTASISGAKVDYTVYYDPTKWIVTPAAEGEDIEYDFTNFDGDVYAMVIPERIELSLDAIRDAALANAQFVAPDMEIVSEEITTVNGVDVMELKMEGTLEGIEFFYFGYYYGGDAGTVQFVTYTTTNLYDDYEDDLTELLKGLVINE